MKNNLSNQKSRKGASLEDTKTTPLDGRRKSQAPPLLEKDMLIPTYKN
jgi:hypothetical protein